MKKADNFNPGNWLVENKITFQSKLNENEEILGLKMTNDGIRNILPGTYFPKENKIIIRTNTQNPKGYKDKSLITITTNQGEYNVQYIPDTDSFNKFNVFNLKSFKELENLLNKIKNSDPSVVNLMKEEKMNENEEDEQVIINGKEVDLGSLELDGVSPSDEISDAYARDAKFTDGTDLNDKEIDEFNKNYIEIVQKMAIKKKSLN